MERSLGAVGKTQFFLTERKIIFYRIGPGLYRVRRISGPDLVVASPAAVENKAGVHSVEGDIPNEHEEVLEKEPKVMPYN